MSFLNIIGRFIKYSSALLMVITIFIGVSGWFMTKYSEVIGSAVMAVPILLLFFCGQWMERTDLFNKTHKVWWGSAYLTRTVVWLAAIWVVLSITMFVNWIAALVPFVVLAVIAIGRVFVVAMPEEK